MREVVVPSSKEKHWSNNSGHCLSQIVVDAWPVKRRKSCLNEKLFVCTLCAGSLKLHKYGNHEGTTAVYLGDELQILQKKKMMALLFFLATWLLWELKYLAFSEYAEILWNTELFFWKASVDATNRVLAWESINLPGIEDLNAIQSSLVCCGVFGDSDELLWQLLTSRSCC